MFRPKEIIYGFASRINPPKNKYLIVIHCDDNLNIIASFTTSQHRSGIPYEQVVPGKNNNLNGELASYVFESGQEIGTDPITQNRFSFPLRTTIAFDYCFVEKSLDVLKQGFQDSKVVCVLDDEFYYDLVYAMYWSPLIKQRYKKILEKILSDHYNQ